MKQAIDEPVSQSLLVNEAEDTKRQLESILQASSERVFSYCDNHGRSKWFFTTFAGIEYGPYKSELVARAKLSQFERWIAEKDTSSERSIANQYLADISQGGN